MFVDEGFGRTTIDAIAEAAGVSRKTVFTAVGGKVEVLKLALDWAIGGDDEPLTLEQRLAARRPRQGTGVGREEVGIDAMLRDWVEVVSPIAARVHGLSAALYGAAAIDDDARTLWRNAQAQRRRGARQFLAYLSANVELPAALSFEHATDIIWLYSDPAIYRRLVIERGWTRKYYNEWLFTTVAQQFRT